MIRIHGKQYANKDRLDILVKDGKFFETGEVRYIKVHYGEHNEGDYAGTTDEGEHYMVSMGRYFPLNKMDEAVEYYGLIDSYYSRCEADPQWGNTSPGKNAAYHEMCQKMKSYGYSIDEVARMNLEYFGASN